MLNSAILFVRAVVSVYFRDNTLNKFSFCPWYWLGAISCISYLDEATIAEDSNAKNLPRMSQSQLQAFVTVGERTSWDSKPFPQISAH